MINCGVAENMREIKFYGGGFLGIIGSGAKLGTLRPRGRYSFEPGEEVLAVCEGEGSLPITIFGTENRKINKTPVPLLLLDGFTSPKVAVARMKNFYPETKSTTEMGLTTFISREKYAGLDENTRRLLVSTPQEEAVKMPELRRVFLPSLAWWLAFNGGNASDWFGFMEKNGLAHENEMSDLRHQYREEIRSNLLRNSEMFRAMIEGREEGPDGDTYREVVLLET